MDPIVSRLNCRLVSMALVCVVVNISGCATLAPNTGLPGSHWTVVDGIIADDTSVQSINIDGKKVWRTLRPSKSEQGVEKSDWVATYLVLIPSINVNASKPSEGHFSDDIRDALAACAPHLGKYNNFDDWAGKVGNSPGTGKVTIGGASFYQYVVYELKWSVAVSNTGRGYRLSKMSVHALGALGKVPKNERLRTTFGVGIDAADRQSGRLSPIIVDSMQPASIKARCEGTNLVIEGYRASASSGPWAEGILKQPYNVVVEVSEEISP